ncbi:MAG: DNA-3-methyladenine glycosylase 2 family protein [Halobacteriales archaeon]
MGDSDRLPGTVPDRDAVEALREDDRLGPLVERHGPVGVAPAADPFRRLVVSVLRQQVSMSAAAAIRERLFDRIEVTPAGVLAADEAAMREAGVSTAKVEYLRALAERWQQEGYSVDYFAGMDDEAVAEELQRVRGVGPWTSDMFLLFGLGRPDVFPVGDLGIREGMRTVHGEDLARAEMRERARQWEPYRSYASRYLWLAVD